MKNKLGYIFVDMDGVLADFLRGCESYLGHPLTNDDKGHTDYDNRKEELTNKRLFVLIFGMNGIGLRMQSLWNLGLNNIRSTILGV